MRNASRSSLSCVALSLCLALLLSAQPAMSQPRSDGEADLIESPLTGTLVDGDLVSIPVRRTSVRASVVGSFASVDVEQLFINSYDEPIEAAYTFPVPSGASIVEMTMRVGDRTMRGEIREKNEAREQYNASLLEGRRAAIVEQKRRAVYATKVGNILPGDRIAITFRYVEPLAYDDGSYALVIPFVIPTTKKVSPDTRSEEPAPRAEDAAKASGAPSAKRPPLEATQENPRKKRSGPRYLPRGARPAHDLAVAVTLNSDVPVLDIASPTHEVTIAEIARKQYRVALKRANEIPDRDFLLTYRVSGERTQAGMLAAPAPDGGVYFMIDTVPPADAFTAGVLQKELTFVVDTSGSMSGARIQDAKNALHTLVHGLNPGDAFNVVRFSDNFSSLRPAPVQFSQESLDAADAFIDGLQAGGGTEAEPAIRFALSQPRAGKRLRIVAFLTDGELGDFEQLMRLIETSLRDARLFTFGVGPAPDDFLSRRMAEAGRGGAQQIVAGGNVEVAVAKFQNDVAAPLLVDVALDLQGAQIVDLSPRPIPDLFASRPLVLYGKADRMPSGTAILTATGPSGRVTFGVPIRTVEGREAEMLGMAWAKTRVNALLDELRQRSDDETLKSEITKLGLEHGLVTPFTSFVITGDEVVARRGSKPKRVDVPVIRPKRTAEAESGNNKAIPATIGGGVGKGHGSGLGPGNGAGQGTGAPRELSGVITDLNGAAIVGATVSLLDSQNSLVARQVTSDDGSYRFAIPAPSEYALRIEAYGFKVYAVEGLDLTRGAAGRHDAQLEVGTVSELVVVTTQESINVSAGDASIMIDSQQLQDLPLDGRSSLELVRVTPGAAPVTPDARDASPKKTLFARIETWSDVSKGPGVASGVRDARASGFRLSLQEPDPNVAASTSRSLLHAQRADGAFAASGAAHSDTEMASTAAAVLAFLLKGETDRAGGHQAQVRRALGFLSAHVDKNGALAGATSPRTEALALWAFSEATRTTGSALYRETAQRIARHLMVAGRTGTDPNALAWAVAALTVARSAGIEVNADVLAATVQALASTPGDDARAVAARAIAESVRTPSPTVEWARLAEKVDTQDPDYDACVLALVASTGRPEWDSIRLAVLRALGGIGGEHLSIEESALAALVGAMAT